MSGSQRIPVLRPHIALEYLEERIAPAGHVVVTVSGGNLTVTGDAESNEFMVDHSGLGADQVRITPGLGTLINGDAGEAIFSGVKGLKMVLGDGDDEVVLNGISLAGNVVIDTGRGANAVTVTSASTIGGSLTVTSNTTWSQDYLEINGCSVLRNVALTTKTGGQTAYIAGSDIGGNLTMKIADMDGDGGYLVSNSSVGGKASLTIGSGYHILGSDPSDSIPFTIEGSTVGSVSMQAKVGDYSFAFIGSQTSAQRKGGISITYGSGDAYTSITGTSTVYGSVSVKTGTKYTFLDKLFAVAWDTEFTLEDSVIAGKLAVSNFDSDDTVTLHASHVYQGTTISNGTGDANVFFGYVLMRPDGGKASALKITSGANGWGFEDDAVSILLDEVMASTLTVSASQASNILIHDLMTDGGMSVTTGAHNDTLFFGNLDITGSASIKTGAGEDAVTVTEHNNLQGALTLDTGAGNDFVGIDLRSDGDASDYYGNVKVTLGAGDDSMQVGQGGIDGNVGRYSKAVVFDGGAGWDSINWSGNGNIFWNAQPSTPNFESIT